MLLSQSVTLQAMFAGLAFQAQQQTHRCNLRTATCLALKAAVGSRQAIIALAEVRMPKQVPFAKQANVNYDGQQQVNDGGAALSGTVRADARAHGENLATAPTTLLDGAPERLPAEIKTIDHFAAIYAGGACKMT